MKAFISASTARRLRRWVQLTSLLLFLALLLRAGLPGPLPGDLFFRLDPLAGLAGAVAARQLVVGMALGGAVALLAAFLLGRAWCGWLCPLGTVIDWTAPRREGAARDERGIAPGWRRAKYILLTVILVAALLGNLTLLFLDPITLIYRTAAIAVWPALNAVIAAAELVLYAVPVAQAPISLVESSLRGVVLPGYQPFYGAGVLVALLFVGLLALNGLAPRFWCRYLCPLGALLALPARSARVQRVAGESCTGCGRCARACPMDIIDARRAFASDPAECTLCLECVPACARDRQTFGLRPRPGVTHTYDPTRRQFLASAGTAVAMVGLLSSEAAAGRDPSRLVRPPGAQGRELLSRCIRCGACLKACPTSGLQPSIDTSGWAGVWTPVLVARIGYCDYNCNACGPACPVRAIPTLSLEEKQNIVIGHAYIDQNRCIPWTDARNCIVCEEMCPLADKAIVLEDVEIAAPDGSTTQVRKPHVLRDRCIGCGLCENHCPLTGDAAIRIYAPSVLDVAG